jgi:hypothetical protein
MEVTDERGEARADVRGEGIADMRDLIGIVAIALSLDQDGALQRELRRCARVQEDRALVVQLPVGGAAIELRARGGIRALRKDTLRGALRLDQLALENRTIRERLRAKGARVFETAQAIVRPLFLPSYLPLRAEYQKLERWSPLIERTAYRMCARSTMELDSWRPAASREVAAGNLHKDGVLEKYYALNHTLAHLTLLCSSVEARPWLVDMAKSIKWIHWTPSFPLIRERTMWLAAPAARSASAFGVGVVDLYLKALAESSHVLKAFDALFGLCAIGLSDEAAIDSILREITRQAAAAGRRQIVGAELAEVAFRSAIAALQRCRARVAHVTESTASLFWHSQSPDGLATVEAFRADPTFVDVRGEMIGFAALPTMLAMPPSFAYPPHAKRWPALLPTVEEMGEIFRRAWVVDENPATIH